MFTKQHYEAIAKIFNHYYNRCISEPFPYTDSQFEHEVLLLNMIIVDISNLFELDNPNFNPTKFWAACHL